MQKSKEIGTLDLKFIAEIILTYPNMEDFIKYSKETYTKTRAIIGK